MIGILPELVQAQELGYTAQIEAHRNEYRAEFLKTPNAPLKTEKALAALRFYAPDSAYRVTARFERTTDAEPFPMPTTSGQTKTYVAYGYLHFTLRGQPQRLTVYRNLDLARLPQYRDYLFIPFRDGTSGKTTYGGGRYLDLRTGELRNESATLDFNKAYNPYCAYADGFACPIPPRENTLKVPVEAGEQTYAAP
jgi:hypothetical protein